MAGLMVFFLARPFGFYHGYWGICPSPNDCHYLIDHSAAAVPGTNRSMTDAMSDFVLIFQCRKALWSMKILFAVLTLLSPRLLR